MPEEEREVQPQQRCPSCEVEIRPGNTFCVACGERVPTEVGNPDKACAGSDLDDSATVDRSRISRKDFKIALGQLTQSASSQRRPTRGLGHTTAPGTNHG